MYRKYSHWRHFYLVRVQCEPPFNCTVEILLLTYLLTYFICWSWCDSEMNYCLVKFQMKRALFALFPCCFCTVSKYGIVTESVDVKTITRFLVWRKIAVMRTWKKLIRNLLWSSIRTKTMRRVPQKHLKVSRIIIVVILKLTLNTDLLLARVVLFSVCNWNVVSMVVILRLGSFRFIC